MSSTSLATAVRPAPGQDTDLLIDVQDLHVHFPTGAGPVHAVRGISLQVRRGETVAVVGESGSGKSVTSRALVGLAGPHARVEAARLHVGGQDAGRFTERDWQRVRGAEIGLVLQDALGSLDPLRTVEQEVGEALRRHGTLSRWDRRGRRAAVEELLAAAGIPDPAVRSRQYPHELSGGLRQRALIASALAGGPSLLIADEPTTALDVTVQAQILDLLAQRKRDGLGLLLVSHDLAVVAAVADRVLVVSGGEVVEEGPVADVIGAPAHPYTRTLLSAIPSAGSRGRRLSPDRAPLPERSIDVDAPVVVADGLGKSFRRRGGAIHAVRDVSLTISRGETLGLVGESGSGKSTVARLLLGLTRPDTGTVRFPGAERPGAGPQLVPQDAFGSFDPRYPVGAVVAEGLGHLDRTRRRARVVELLDQVGLPASVAERYPRQLSGGQRQRVAIARAIGPRPRLLVCDEPVSALDVSVQAQVLDLLAELQAELGTAVLFVSHDLGVVHHVSDRVLVMRHGEIVESGPVQRVFRAPAHPYTELLLDSLPPAVRPIRPPHAPVPEPGATS
ncbi:ABC transporter ATP-binding protein [Pseudonocardia sp. NPDC046786]|uniref:ABC transporter ATP-binding protein n=1 Tax=Pseudonocardia sp. NPDC046786 TaxID=3155471 RepID=UPI0033F54767